MKSKKIESLEIEIGGKKLIIKSGDLATQATSSCTVQYGDTVVLATVCMPKTPRDEVDYFPLMVDFDEKLYAAGKIKGSRFIKREGRPSDEAILTDRLIDRALRPLFPVEIRNDIHVVITVLSFDQENDPDIVGLNAASTSLAKSNIPWSGPLAAIRVGQINGEWILNPSYEARAKSDLDLIIAGTKDEIVMMEGSAKEVSEETINKAIEFGFKHLRKTLKLIEEVQKKIGEEKIEFVSQASEVEKQTPEALKAKVETFSKDKIKQIISKAKDKKDYYTKIDQLKEGVNEVLKTDNQVTKEERVKGIKIIDELIEKYARQLTLETGVRVDGRQLDEIRPLDCQVGILPRTHGSGLFTRGETQVLSVVTLGSPSEEQLLDTMEESGKKRYMHHYNFPGFSVGEVIPLRGPGRREIGHGALAEKALLPLLPDKEEFPYTVRVVSEVLSSNGSSSMASVCGSSLALMDAGVPLKKAVAGIAMGIFSDPQNTNNYRILTDIQGVEDHAGDMDFKVAGTQDGITAIQLDIKLNGISPTIVNETLIAARQARLKILETMNKAIKEPRAELSPYAPRIYTIQINPERIRDVIGPGGKIINEIIDETGVTIDIEDDGLVMVTAVKEEAANKAINWIKNLTREVKVGETFQGKVTKLFDFGVMVEIMPRQEGLIHISEVAPFRIPEIRRVIKIGDIVPVKVISIDELGRVNLSLKQTDFDFSKMRERAMTNNHYTSPHRFKFGDKKNNFRKKKFT